MGNLVTVVTGAASGLGRAAATHLDSQGHTVLGGGFGLPDTYLPFATRFLDVCDDESVRDFFVWAHEQAGRIDALVNCAGIQIAGALETMLVEETQRILDTNVVGTVRCCRQVLPFMRAQGAGRIINVSSLGGRIAFPFHTSYCASKFAVEGLSECLRYEVRDFGIHVSVLAPGSFYTPIAEKSECSANADQDTVYAATLRRVVDANREECRKRTDLLPFARKVESILLCSRPKLRYFVGRSDQGMADQLRRWLPEGWMEASIRRAFGLDK